jgi:hypothetical protein
MADVATLLKEFVDELSAGGQPDALSFIDRAESEDDRKELAGLIDLSLTMAPEGLIHPRDETGSFVSPLSAEQLSAVVDAALAEPRGWPVVIPELRAAAGKTVDQVAEEVVEAGGFAASDENLSAVYRWLKDMEAGLVGAREISRAALGAVARALGTAADELAFQGDGPDLAAANFRADDGDHRVLAHKLGAVADMYEREADDDRSNPVDAWFSA